MKKIDISQKITQKLNKEPLNYLDLMNKNIRIDSYEKYIQEFSLLKHTYEDKLPEFNNIAVDYLNKMDVFINNCINVDDDKLDEHINREIFNNLIGSSYNSQKQLKIVFTQSLSMDNERSINTIVQIYFELGYDNMLSYLELLKNPNSFTSFLNDSSKQRIAMDYLLFKTNHHSNSKLQRNRTATNLYNEMENNITDSIKEITSEKDDYISYMNSEKEKFNEWFNNNDKDYGQWLLEIKNGFSDFIDQSNQKLQALENTYSEKLKVEEPSKFMKENQKSILKKRKHGQ